MCGCVLALFHVDISLLSGILCGKDKLECLLYININSLKMRLLIGVHYVPGTFSYLSYCPEVLVKGISSPFLQPWQPSVVLSRVTREVSGRPRFEQTDWFHVAFQGISSSPSLPLARGYRMFLRDKMTPHIHISASYETT